MSRFLIVNADDFGLCEEITRGIVKTYEQGIVRSTSVTVNGAYFNQGLSLLKDSNIDAGIHLTFVGGEKPVSGYIDGLVGENGLFLKSYREAAQRIISGKFDKKALQRELREQVSVLKDSGVNISHIDSHQHLHLLPPLITAIRDIANQFKIKWIRAPHSNLWGIDSMGINILGSLLKRQLTKHGFRFTDNFIGFEHRGRLNETALLAQLENLKNGITELMAHPGYDARARYDWGYSWEAELLSLTAESVKKRLKLRDITLTSFRDIK